MEGLMKMNRI